VDAKVEIVERGGAFERVVVGGDGNGLYVCCLKFHDCLANALGCAAFVSST
jgi:hypothetical protein